MQAHACAFGDEFGALPYFCCTKTNNAKQEGLKTTLKQRKDMGVSDDILRGYRESIDNIDAALVFMLAERFKITQKVGAYKAEAGLPPADPGRESAQIERLRALAQSANLDPEFSEKFLRFIIDEVIRHHQHAADHARTAG